MNQTATAAAPTVTPQATAQTPLMAQYLSIKEEVGADTILFYRMGDFYEMFFPMKFCAVKSCA